MEPIDDFLIVEGEAADQPADAPADEPMEASGEIGDVIDDYLPADAPEVDESEVGESDLDGLISSLGEF